MIIREATVADNERIGELFGVIFGQMDLAELRDLSETKRNTLIGQIYGSTKLKAVAKLMVAEIDGYIVGAAYSYDGNNETKTDEVIREQTGDYELHPDQEAQADEWYLEMLVADSEFRGQGIGSALMKNVENLAITSGLPYFSLNVDFANEDARRLYLRQGFVDDGVIKIGEHDYYHMKKQIN
ncbi:GNAT family N-acetyltransferase [Periweissella cryptocerci]|uniref:GNAT family N-acetyltransferase n=1 Tax=Periweissella cryptocerci TaxID=2506420 RepID=A0A4P6YVV0_9LACO|nr:GNAT family N-acetyltransferase [Periweissella cryptocerci]QBO36857.1 GNAT family N-acetyltransferase [Periweissella cryptocerci]